jgi:hypothetical protein
MVSSASAAAKTVASFNAWLWVAQRSLSDWRADAANWPLCANDQSNHDRPGVISKDTKQHTTKGFSRFDANFV